MDHKDAASYHDTVNLVRNGDTLWNHLARLSNAEIQGLELALDIRDEPFILRFDGERDPADQLRMLDGNTRNRLLRTDDEIGRLLPPDLPVILEIHEWKHPEFGEPASDSESFRQLADVASTADRRLLKPTQRPSTAWENWPDAGSTAWLNAKSNAARYAASGSSAPRRSFRAIQVKCPVIAR
jgi:hypothetical protein